MAQQAGGFAVTVLFLLPLLGATSTHKCTSAHPLPQAGISMLGNMAFCAPKQLGQCLPQIVPRLVDSFDDPHPRVQAAGKEALQQVRLTMGRRCSRCVR